MTSLAERWQRCIEKMPLVAILRGITPEEVVPVGKALVESGFSIIEVPLNSPQPYESIGKLVDQFGGSIIVGAGTVLCADDVSKTIDAGGSLVVAPNLNESVATSAVDAGAIYCPGVATPTEAFKALEFGAQALKLFPAEMITPTVVKAMRAVLPQDLDLLAVGGITPVNMPPYLKAGCTGFGIGSALYKPGKSIAEIELSAVEFVTAVNQWH